ncbi:MAG: DEAD/DEAH box helicase [Candidatus Hadarchaeia archaeon]
MGLSCPNCRGEIKYDKVESGRWLFSCSNCSMCFAPDKRDLSLNEAYQELEDLHKEGELTDLGKTWVRRHGLIKEARLLGQNITKEDFANLPSDVKGLIHSNDELVKYKLLERSSPDPGASLKEAEIHPLLKESLFKNGIKKLYRFQERAIEKIMSGKNVVISAPTATGKTEAFILPVYQKILERKETEKKTETNAILVYPTKVLSRDQARKLRKLGNNLQLDVQVYDGDTEKRKRAKILSDPPEVLITNFDMIHFHLSHRTEFSRLLKSAKFVIVDEIHTYTGSFGSNVHFIIKRMRREFNNSFQIIGASATIFNPKEFAEDLFGESVEVIKCEEGKHGPIHFLMLYPRGRSTKTMLIDCLKNLRRNGRKTVVFGNSHQGVESMSKIAEERGGIDAEVHRAGLPYQYRREVAKKLKDGSIKSVVSTPTLELGVDIGDLDAVASVLVGITSFKQRIGRAARRGQEGVAILGLRNEDPISSFYRRNPEDYFKDVDPGYCEPKNPIVAENQIIAAAMDHPLSEKEFPNFEEKKSGLIKKGLLKKDKEHLHVTNKGRSKLGDYSIRGIGESVDIIYGRKRIGTRQMPIASQELHPGAIYLHGGRKYRSKKFSIEEGKAIVEKEKSDTKKRTNAKKRTIPIIVDKIEEKKCLGSEIAYCKLKIKDRIDGYYEIDVFSDEILAEQKLDNPIEYSFLTFGLVFKAPTPEDILNLPEEDREKELGGTFHAIEHAILEGTNMLTGGGSDEVGGVAMGSSGYIFAYDGSAGGNGISKLLFERFEDSLKRAYKILEGCNCKNENGCPNCTQSYRCGSNNEPLSKKGAITSLNKMLEREKTRIERDSFKGMNPIV